MNYIIIDADESNPNIEKVVDLIYDYLDILDSVNELEIKEQNE